MTRAARWPWFPAGTGGAVMANTKVEVFGNTFSGNTAAGFSVISCFAALGPGDLPSGTSGYVAVPSQVYVHDNTFTNNGTNPLSGNTDTTHPSYQLAALLASGFQPPGLAGGHVSDVSYDGISACAGGTGNPYADLLPEQRQWPLRRPPPRPDQPADRPSTRRTRSTRRPSTARSRPCRRFPSRRSERDGDRGQGEVAMAGPGRDGQRGARGGRCGSSANKGTTSCTPSIPTDETFPSNLADWCQVSLQQGEVTPLASDVVPFALTTPLFSDGATKRRTVRVPPGTSAVYDPSGRLRLP